MQDVNFMAQSVSGGNIGEGEESTLGFCGVVRVGPTLQ